MIRFLSIFIFIPIYLTAQEGPVLTKNFQFADGVYLSFEEFQSNTPAFPLDGLTIHSFTNPQTSLTQIDSIFHVNANKSIDQEKIWAVSLNGVPFIKLPKNEIYKQMPSYAALKLRGKICYYTYPDYQMKKIPIKAYNPLTGYPFLHGEVEREEKRVVEKMLHFETGEIVDFNLNNLKAWIQEDKHLIETIEKTPVEEVEEKLFRLLLIYVDRHETRIKTINQ